MNQAVKTLIPIIASYIKEKDGNLSKTKLLKLLYLFDIEYYRLHRQTYTGFKWKFFHLGPWTNEIDALLDELIKAGHLIAKPYSTHEYDSFNYEAAEESDTSTLFANIRDEAAINRVLSLWGERSLGEILDYVYFHTAPMEQGLRNAPLDFSVISSEAPVRYTRSSSQTPPRDVAQIRKSIRDKQARLNAQKSESFEFTPPRYDEEFFRALSKLDEAPA